MKRTAYATELPKLVRVLRAVADLEPGDVVPCRAVIESPIVRPPKHRGPGPASLAAHLAAPHRNPAGHDRFAAHVRACSRRKGRS